MTKSLCVSIFAAGLFLVGAASAEIQKGVVTSATPEATKAGIEILNKGGNAVDAAIAVSLALGVSEPAGSGLGGQTVMLVARPGETPKVIHGTTFAPRATPKNPERALLRAGHTATTVPSNLKVLDRAHREFGSGLSWPELVAPAINVAEKGFVVGGFRARSFNHYLADLSADPVAARLFLHRDGLPYQEGEVLKQPTLAKTLKRIAKHGAEGFYTGDIAKAIAEDMATNGGWLTLADLAAFPEPPIVDALHGVYRGHDVYTLPPPFGGWVMLHALNSLSDEPQSELSSVSATRDIVLIEALHAAHSTRRKSPIPDWRNPAAALEERLNATPSPPGETTHFTVVDSDGMIVAVTQSIDGYFGAKAASPELGFLYNNYMNSLDDEGPYAAGPGKAPLSSMSASIVYRRGEPVLALGSPGSARIISAVAQVISYWIDIGENIDEAVGAFRVHATPGNRAYIENPEIERGLLAALSARGFELRRPYYGVARGALDPYFGGVHAIGRENDAWVGAADPRRDGAVAYTSHGDVE